jgi:hypothetical protein
MSLRKCNRRLMSYDGRCLLTSFNQSIERTMNTIRVYYCSNKKGRIFFVALADQLEFFFPHHPLGPVTPSINTNLPDVFDSILFFGKSRLADFAAIPHVHPGTVLQFFATLLVLSFSLAQNQLAHAATCVPACTGACHCELGTDNLYRCICPPLPPSTRVPPTSQSEYGPNCDDVCVICSIAGSVIASILCCLLGKWCKKNC